jgi:hypothetical protein
MGFGRYRFRRSFGQVKAQFRGARPKFYPLFTGLLDTYAGAAAAYSLRRLSKIASSVVRVRRASDNAEKDFTADNITDGAMVNWVNGQIVPPLDIRELDANGERTGDLVEAAAAYSLRNLSSSFTGNVVDVRRSSDDAEESFTASDVADGTLTDWVNTTPIATTAQNSTSNPYSTFTNASTTGFTATLSSGVAYAGFGGVSGSSGDSVTVSFDLDIVSGSPFLALREGTGLINSKSNSQVYSSSGSYSLTMTATGDFGFIGFSEGDIPSEFTVSNFEITAVSSNDGFVSKWYDQSGNANHATQGTNAKQPKIVDGGSLVSGGILSDGAGTFLELNSALSISDEFDIFFTGTATASDWSGLQRSPYGFSTNADYPRFNDDAFRYTIAGSDSGTISYNSGFTIGVGNPFLYNFNRNAADSVGAQINGIAQTNRVTLSGTHQISQLFRRGANTTQIWDGTMSEMIFYNSDQSDNRTAIEANIGETYSIDLPSGVDTGYDQVDGFVETWYDQSGNGNDAVQQVSGSQPKIVDAGVLVSGGIEFDGVDDYLTTPSLYSSDISIFNAITSSNTVNTNNFMRMVHLCDGSDSFQLARGGGVDDIGKLMSKNTSFQSGAIGFKHGDINGLNLISAITSSTNTDAYVDSSLQSNFTDVLGAGNSTPTTIGARDDLLSSSFFAGSYAEIIIYNSDQSANRAAIETNINDHYDIYP